MPTQHIYLVSSHHKCNMYKTFEISKFCPKFAPSLPTVHLIHFLSSFFCPHQNPWGQSFLSHSISNLIGKDGGYVFKPHPPLLPSLLAWPSPLTWVLNYLLKYVRFCSISISLTLETQIQKTAYVVLMFWCPPLLSDFCHLHTFLWYHVNISDMFLFKLFVLSVLECLLLDIHLAKLIILPKSDVSVRDLPSDHN